MQAGGSMPQAHRLQNRTARPADPNLADEASGPCVAGYQLSLDDEGLLVLQITRRR